MNNAIKADQNLKLKA